MSRSVAEPLSGLYRNLLLQRFKMYRRIAIDNGLFIRDLVNVKPEEMPEAVLLSNLWRLRDLVHSVLGVEGTPTSSN